MKKLNRERVQKLYVDINFERISKIIPLMTIYECMDRNEEKVKKELYKNLWDQMDDLSNSDFYDLIKKDAPHLLDEYNDKNLELKSTDGE